MSIFKFELGSKARDTITEFSGIITARTQYLNGCVRYGIQPQELKDGLPIDAVWIDEGQIELIGKAVSIAQKSTGGPQIAPPRQKDAPL